MKASQHAKTVMITTPMFVHSFFIRCYHIRDRVLTLSKIDIETEYVDDYIRSHLELRVCADLSNAACHTGFRHPHVTPAWYP